MTVNDLRAEMEARYSEFIASTKLLRLDSTGVPEGLRPYIPFAELRGLSDDLERELLVERAPLAAKTDLTRLVEKIDDALDEWLAGPEADNPFPSPEYVAFSAMRMAADYAS